MTISSSIADEAGSGGNALHTGGVIINGNGTVLLKAAGSYAGDTTIDLGTFELGNSGSLAGNVEFADTSPSETLRLDVASSQLGGNVGDFTASDSIDLAFLGFSGAISALWLETGSNSGTLSLVENGSIVAAVNLTGQYASSDFTFSNDGHGGTAIGLTNPATAAGTTAAIIMRKNSGTLEIYDLGNNTVLGSAALGNVGSSFQIVGLGGFFSSDTSDIMLRNVSTGAFQIDDVSNNNITNSVAMGQVGPEWQVAGFGDFSSRGETDMLMRNSNTGAVRDLRHQQ